MNHVPSIHQTASAAHAFPDSWRADLRRRRGRDFTQAVLDRAEHLAPGDRELITAVYASGRPLKAVAALMGVSPRALGRRCKRIVDRLLSPAFAFVVMHAASWSPSMRSVACAMVLHGQTQREAARALHLSYHTVRRLHDAVLAMAAGAHEAFQAARELAGDSPSRRRVHPLPGVLTRGGAQAEVA